MNSLYIDESGNTGETLSKDSKFNFAEQPYYILAGIVLDDKLQNELSAFLNSLISKYRIQGNELKAKNLYETNLAFIEELVDYLIYNEVPFFIELMDKLFYLNIYLVKYFIIPHYSLPINNENILKTRYVTSIIGQLLNQNIYQSFTDAVKENSNDSLEKFYDILINHFEQIGCNEIKNTVELTKIDYLEEKKIDSTKALRKFLPIPDENPNKRLIYFLPNFSAFTNLVARAQKYADDFLTDKKIAIIHDEQKQFDIIFQSALEQMKNSESDKLLKNTFVADKARYNIEKDITLLFKDSKSDVFIQVSDLIAGIIMRFWRDFISGNNSKVSTYLPVIKKLSSPYNTTNIGINYVVPDFQFNAIMEKIYNG